MNVRVAKGLSIRAAVLSCPLILAGCAALLDGTNVLGAVTLQGTELGSWTLSFYQGRSGLPQSFFGADFVSTVGTIRAIRNEKREVTLLLTSPDGKKKVELTKADCSTLDLEMVNGYIGVNSWRDPAFLREWAAIERKGERHPEEGNNPGYLSGRAAFACSLPTGGSMRGEMAFRCE